MKLELKMWTVLVRIQQTDWPDGATEQQVVDEVGRLMTEAGRLPARHPGQYREAVIDAIDQLRRRNRLLAS